jgi:hypothetical protein
MRCLLAVVALSSFYSETFSLVRFVTLDAAAIRRVGFVADVGGAAAGRWAVAGRAIG